MESWGVTQRWPSLEEILQFQNSLTPGSFLFYHPAQLNAASSSSTRAPSPAPEPFSHDDICDDPLLQDLINDTVTSDRPESSTFPTVPTSTLHPPNPPVWIILDESDDEHTACPQTAPLPPTPPSPISPSRPPLRSSSPGPPPPSAAATRKRSAAAAAASPEPPTKRTRSSRQKAWFEGLYGEAHKQKFAVCKFFAASGTCRSGLACRFSHDVSVEDGGGRSHRGINEPCMFLFAQAPFECKKVGERGCAFRHDLQEMPCVWREMHVPCRRVGGGGKTIGECPFNHRCGTVGAASEAEKVEFIRLFRSVLTRTKGEQDLWWHEYLRRDVDELAFL